MPLFEYLCDSCGHFQSLTRGDRQRCPNCGATSRRRFAFNPKSPFQDHYNMSVGRYVHNETDFRDGLKKASETQTLRTGLEHHYEPIDYRDRDACGITDEHIAALDETKRREAAVKSS